MKKKLRSRAVLFEAVEPRLLFANIINVLNTGDSGADSLRAALAAAQPGDTIDLTAVSGTITLQSELSIATNVTLHGPGASALSISGNDAVRGFSVSAANVTIDNLTVTHGRGDGSLGGGIITGEGTLNLDHVVVSNNSVTDKGGGIANFGTLNMTDCTVSNNTVAGGSQALGGAIYSSAVGGGVHLNRCTFTGNSATLGITNAWGSAYAGGGAVVLFGNSHNTFTNCTFTDNAIEIQPLVQRREIAYCQGGAIYSNDPGGLDLLNCTIVNNRSISPLIPFCDSYAGGAWIAYDGTVTNSIIAGNTGWFSPDASVSGENPSGGHNVIGQYYDGEGFIDGVNGDIVGDYNHPIDPKVGALADNGGATQTMAVLDHSPAVDAGDTQAAPATDQRGVSRLGNADVGAVESAFSNQAPVLVGTPITTATGETKYSYDVSATDPDGDPLSFALAGYPPYWLTLTDHGNGTATLSGTPTNDDAEFSQFRRVKLKVTDGGAFARQSFTILVSPINHAPTFTSSPITTATSETAYSYDISGDDVDWEQVSFSDGGSLPSWLTLTNTGWGTANLSGTPTNADAGDVAVEIDITDGTNTVHQNFTLQVSAINHAPAFTSTPVTSASSGTTYSYGIVATDSDSESLAFTEVGNLPSWLTLTDHGDGTATLSGTPTNSNAGDVAVKIDVSDGTATVHQNFTLHISSSNRAPSVTAAAEAGAVVGNAFSQTVFAADLDGNPLTFAVVSKPDWITVTDNGNGSATFTGTPAIADGGNNVVTLKVNDGTIDSSPRDFAINVVAPRWQITAGVLQITGTNGDDVIQAWQKGNQIRVIRNSVIKNFSISGINTVELYGFDGNDSLSLNFKAITGYAVGNAGADLLVGGDEIDILSGGGGKDTLIGGAGDDRLNGFVGNDSLDGGYGDDRLFGGDGNDVLVGGNGIDQLRGEEGDDTLYSRDNGTIDFIAGGNGFNSAQIDPSDQQADLLSLLP